MKKIYYGYSNIEWLVCHEDDVYYYAYEVAGRELFTYKFPKKDSKIVGSSNYRCMNCGRRFGSNGCRQCSPYVQWWNNKWWYPTITEEGEEKSDEWWAKNHVCASRMGDDFSKSWVEKDWAKDDKYPRMLYFCHNCKYFNFHRINYCYKCGGKIVSQKIFGSELRKKHSDYLTGF